MNTQNRKLKQRIVRRKEKVERMIEEQKARLAALESATFLHQQDHYKATGLVREKLYHLEQELMVLKLGWLLDEV